MGYRIRLLAMYHVNHDHESIKILNIGDDTLDPSDATQLVIIFALMLFSSFFSAAETAFTKVNKMRIRILVEDGVKSAKRLNDLLEEPNNLINTILISDSIANLVAVTLASIMAYQHLEDGWLASSIVLLTILILIFCEIIPKTIATLYPEKVSLTLIVPIVIITRLLSPFVYILTTLCHGLLRLININPNAKSAPITEHELLDYVDVSHEEGIIESEERRMITNVVDFGDYLAKDVMVPRIDMAFASVDFTYEELVETFKTEKYTRLPVYSESRDNVVGIINLKDLFFYEKDIKDFNIQDILREASFTYEFKKTSELLIEMRRDSIPLSIVLDEYGAIVGLITIEDLLEEIVGDIRDEYDDDEEDCIQKVSDNEYIVDGNTKLDEINEIIGLDIESDDYDSLAGHVIYLLDHLPEVGENVTEDKVIFTVAGVTKNRIDKIHIQILTEEVVDEDHDKDED